MVKVKTNNMINLIKEIVPQMDYENFAVGITDNRQMWYRLNHKHDTVVLSYKSATIIKDAFRYCVEQGMVDMPQIGNRVKCLYIFRTDEKELKNIFKNDKL